MALSAMLNKLDGQLGALIAFVMGLAGISHDKWAKPAAEAIPGNGGVVHRAAQASTIISVVVIGIIALIGILIFATVSDALPEIESTELDAASTSVTEGFASAMELVPIVLLVLVAALVISVVQRMRSTNGM